MMLVAVNHRFRRVESRAARPRCRPLVPDRNQMGSGYLRKRETETLVASGLVAGSVPSGRCNSRPQGRAGKVGMT